MAVIYGSFFLLGGDAIRQVARRDVANREEEAMSAQAEPEVPLPAAHRSKTLTAVVVILLLLPLVLPVPFVGIARLWLEPMIQAKRQACASLDCPAAFTLDQLSVLLILGPSLLVAVVTFLLGTIGLIRRRWHPTSPNHEGLFGISMVGGAAWVVLLGLLLWVILTVLLYL